MRLLTPDGSILGGADVLVHLGRLIWWAAPIRLIALLPGGLTFLRRCYRRIAASRYCAAGSCAARPTRTSWPRLLPVLAAAIHGWAAFILNHSINP
jgi:hypothetical protein